MVRNSNPIHYFRQYFLFISTAPGARAAGHVFSQNIVGYTKVDLTGIVGSQQQTGAQFTLVGINEDPLDIHKIILEDAATGTSIRWFRPGDAKYDIAMWLDYDEDGEDVDPSWRDIYGKLIVKTFVPGEAYWIMISGKIGPNPALLTAGQVLLDPFAEYFSLPLTVGSQDQRVNPLPVAIDIHDIMLSNAATGASIRWFRPGDGKYDIAMWLDYDEDGEDVDPSWRDIYGKLIDKEFFVGEAFWVMVSGALKPLEKTEVLFKNPLFGEE